MYVVYSSLASTIQCSLVFVSFLYSLLFIADDRSCNLVMNTYNDISKDFDIDIIIDTLCERFLSCSVVRRLKTKRLTRLSVYVERKNVCKWSLVYLQVGSYFKAFC